MQKIVITSPEELKALIEGTLQKVFESHLPKSQESNSNRLLTVAEAADYLSLAKQTLYGFTSKNQIPHIKRAKRLLFKKGDLDNWLMEGRKKSINEIQRDLENH